MTIETLSVLSDKSPRPREPPFVPRLCMLVCMSYLYNMFGACGIHLDDPAAPRT